MNVSRSAGGQPWLCMPADSRFSSEGSSATRCRRSSGDFLGWMLQTRSSSVVTAEPHASLSSPSFR